MADGKDSTNSETADGLAKHKRPLTGWISISLAAFIMSATTTLLNTYFALQGSEISIQKPQHVLLYRDGVGENAVLSVAMRLEAINTASSYGDVVLDTHLSVGQGRESFAQEGQASPAFTTNAQVAAQRCPLDQSCVIADGLIVVQRNDQIMDLPGGAAKALTPYFWLVEQSCSGAQNDCARWRDFTSASQGLQQWPITFRVKINFRKDGERTIVCVTPPLDGEYLADIGWTQLPCTEARVEGDSWL